MSYGTRTVNNTRLGAVAVVPDRHDDGQRQVPRLLEEGQALPARGPRRTIPATSTGGSGPTTASTAPSPTSMASRRAARPCRPTSRTTPTAFLGQHDIKFGAQYTKGRGNRQERLLPELRQLPVPVPLDAERRGDAATTTATTGSSSTTTRTRVNPVLTVRTADSLGGVRRRPVVDQQAAHAQRGPALRPHDHASTGRGKVYDFVTSPEQINDPPPVLRDRAGTENIFDFKTLRRPASG